VLYQIAKMQPIHPIIIGIFKIIDTLDKLPSQNSIKQIQAITQLDNEILVSILSQYNTQGHIEGIANDEIALTDKGKEALKQAKERIIQNETAYIITDEIVGRCEKSGKKAKDIMPKSYPPKDFQDYIELKSNPNTRPKSERLNDEFSDDKTLGQVFIEGLKGLDTIESKQDKKYNKTER